MTLGRTLEKVLLSAGLALMAIAVVWYASGRIQSRMSVTRFHSAVEQERQKTGSLSGTVPVDTSMWSEKRIHQYEEVLAEDFDAPLGILRIDRIHLEVPVFNGTDERILNRGVGRVIGTARIGEAGNLGIAGHRDGFFRGLKDVTIGDAITLETADGTQTYTIDSIQIVSPKDVSVLEGGDTPALTLVTCYPFYFIGNAPQRYIVHASMENVLKPDTQPRKAQYPHVVRTEEKTQ